MPDSVNRIMLHGYELSYVDVGQGPAVVFVHGLMSSHRTWGTQLGQLARRHRVVAPDLFGHGESDKPVGDYSLGAHAATLRDLFDALDIRSATLVGLLTGTGIGFLFDLYYKSLNYPSAGLTTLAIVVAVVALEAASNALRRVIL